MENKSQKQINDEQLRVENQVRKLKLELEYGAKFGSFNPNHVLPPYIEKMFLDNVERVEKAFKEAKKIKIYDLIGRPEFKKATTLSEDDIAQELRNVQELLFNHQIICDSIYPVDDRTFYTFLTEELFEQLTEQVNVPGYIVHLIYEDFHPNHIADIGEMCCDFIMGLLKHDEVLGFEELKSTIKNLKQLNDFRDSFSSFDVAQLETESVVINENTAVAILKADYTGVIESSSIRQNFSGKISLDLFRDSKWWDISHVTIPGLNGD